MLKSLPVFVAVLLAVTVRAIAASSQADLDQEYIQVRKIALKDPRVQDAFARANQRLNDKILEIDPSLKPMVDRQGRAPIPAPTVAPRMARRVPVRTEPFRAGSGTHVVAKGETLSSIAAQYRVKVSAIERINRITNDRRLQVGQKLVIPGGSSPAGNLETKPAAESPTPKPESNSGSSLLDHIKNDL
jgi:nucleoid-associated protein YgaU